MRCYAPCVEYETVEQALGKKQLFWVVLAMLMIALAIIQFVPPQ